MGLSQNLAITLLDIYWTWQHPSHNCVYRPCKAHSSRTRRQNQLERREVLQLEADIVAGFIMNLTLGGIYYSEFLLISIFALVARHVNENDERFKNLGEGAQFLPKQKNCYLERWQKESQRSPQFKDF